MNTKKERILLVENNPEISDLISRQTLQPMGYKVNVVGGAASAIQEAVRFAPDIIIANLNLPGLSGKDLLVALSSQGMEVPIIVLTVEGKEADAIQAFRLGASDFLSLPIREAEVLSAVERVLLQVRAQREREILARQLQQTNQELQRRVRELTTLSAIGKAVISATDQQLLFDKIVEGAVYVAEANSGWFLIRDASSKNFILMTQENLPNSAAEKLHKPWDDGLSSLVALSGEPLSIHGDPLKRFKVAKFGKSALVVPVKVKNDVIGLLTVVRTDPKPFSSSQQSLLEAVADYASISLVNARLYKALEDRVHVLQKTAADAQLDDRIKDEILAQVTHELRSNLMLVVGNVDMLLSNERGRLTAEQSDYLQAVHTKTQNVLNLVEMTSTLQQMDMGKKKSATNMNELTRQAIARFQEVARQSSISLVAELPSNPILIIGNLFQIASVYDGLLSNAVKSSTDGDQITLRVEPTRDYFAHISVQDHGRGIEPKNLPYIFDQGKEGKGMITSSFGGIGINLQLVKEIITSHGGKIWVDSQSGKGSTFHFTLPMASIE
jgi:signal transduction histidine kinase/DNA-binding response OmpR family regulator